MNNPGAPGTTPSPSQGSGPGGGSGGSNGGPAPTSPTSEETLVNGNCLYAADPTYVPQPGTDTHSGQKGAWYLETCPDGIKLGGKPGQPVASTTQQMVWLTNPPPAALMQPTPAVLAARARNSLVLPKPVISSNPPVGSPQWVGVPTWAFLPRSVWAPVSASAEVPGMRVLATATPVSVTWDFGDGTSTVCAGPGTPFTPGTDPKASSPDCGHTYRTSSGAAPGGVFQVAATISWRVDWVGAGQAGTLADLTTTATIPVTVQQSQAIVTGTG
ncbi:hypothetical protein [Catenulispora rubra]|uniref:hypothetical protein n=1 Tax=Catenulispora rubra TaxID=280293 RepID=UPI0018926F7E|nr:hypothetical protein [Catenulispora rubra]